MGKFNLINMALINTKPKTPIRHPNKEGVLLEVSAVYLIPSQVNKETTTIQVEFYKQGEGVSKINGFIPTEECGPFNLGEAPTTGDKPSYWQDIHDFAISKLGPNFQIK